MIHEIYSNKEDYFSHIYFKKGLNIILADGDDESNENSRNGLGKTTLIRVIHFCLGANKDDKLPIRLLGDWNFTIILDLFNEKIKATRSFRNMEKIIVEGNFENFPFKPEYSDENDIYFYKLNNWRIILGMSLFGLKSDYKLKYKPTFRMLISYFIRRSTDFNNPFKTTSSSHKPIYSDICTSLFLGLDWKLTSEYKTLKDDNKELGENLRNIKNQYGTVGKIRPEKNRLENEVNNIKNQLDTFKIHEFYHESERKANELTEEIHKLSNYHSLLNKKLKFYENSIDEENFSVDFNIEKIYNESQMYFSDNIKKTLNEAKEFHKSIISNRKKFLENEINSINNNLIKISKQMELKSNERAKHMKILNNFGALKDYTNINQEYIEKQQKLNEIVRVINKHEDISNSKNEIKMNLLELENKFKLNYDENKMHLDKLINLFSENSSKLYETPGDLIIDCNENGFKFNIDIPRLNSDGKTKMIILCYDLMLLEEFFENKLIDFLIHDSNIYDGVDGRQYANSLNLIYEKGLSKNIQYICMLNSDSIPKQKLNFNLNDVVVLTLSDESVDGTLFGFDFEV